MPICHERASRWGRCQLPTQHRSRRKADYRSTSFPLDSMVFRVMNVTPKVGREGGRGSLIQVAACVAFVPCPLRQMAIVCFTLKHEARPTKGRAMPRSAQVVAVAVAPNPSKFQYSVVRARARPPGAIDIHFRRLCRLLPPPPPPPTATEGISKKLLQK